MPLWYAEGTRREHMAVLTSAGLFDTSHMSMVLVDGKDAFSLLQKTFSKDLSRCTGKEGAPLASGRAVYGVFLNAEGHLVDDALVYRLSGESYMVCVNAGMGGVVSRVLENEAEKLDARVADMTDRLGKIDIQGPASAKILKRVLPRADDIFSSMPYFSFKGHFDSASPFSDAVKLSGGAPILLSRTGYTGEFGFELFVSSKACEPLWLELMAAGETFGLAPCGLAARDSLRAGAVLPLSHQDIGPWLFGNTPWDFVLPRDKGKGSFTKEFSGGAALKEKKPSHFTYAFAGFDPRKVTAGKESRVLDMDGETIGEVLTCTTDVSLGRKEGAIVSSLSEEGVKGLCCGFVRVDRRLDAGEKVVLFDGKRRLTAEIALDIRPGRTARRALARML